MEIQDMERAGLLRSVILALALSAGLTFSTQSDMLLRPWLNVDLLRSIPYGRAALATIADLAVLYVLLRLAGASSKQLTRLSGLFQPISRVLVFGVLAIIPAIALCAVLVPLATDVTASDLAWKTFGGPFFEELGFRGLAVGVLICLCRWPTLIACVWPALFFGAAHAWQGDTWQEVVGIVAITGAGGLLFGWLYVRWNFNLWPSVTMHVGLNGIWLLFDLGNNAIGGWFGNALRLAVVIGAIGLTLWLSPKPAGQQEPTQDAS